jgi:glycosyltransferase involved in cell wall biosynthesis
VQIVALIAAYNEERFIGGCLEHLLSHGLEVYLCDNGSTDRTVEIASRYLGEGLRGIEPVPRDGTFRWRALLERKEELGAELTADWFIHMDADEIPLPALPGATLAEALREVDAGGWDAVEFSEFTFVPTRESPDHDHRAFRDTMHWYYPFAPSTRHLVRAWKRRPRRVDLAGSGGHTVAFPGQRIFPARFRLLHYLFLSEDHAVRKYVNKRYDVEETSGGWHGWRATLRADHIRLPEQSELRFAATPVDLDPGSPRTTHCLEWERADERRITRRVPRVLVIVDRAGWAHDRKSQALAAALAPDYRIVKRFHGEVTADDVEDADLVLLYYWLQLDKLGPLADIVRRRRDRLLLGVCSDYELQGEWREPGLEVLRRLPHAVFANNLTLATKLEGWLERPVAYTPNGVDTTFFHPSASRPRRRELRVGWAGSLTNQTPAHRGVHDYIAPAVSAVHGAQLCLAAREQRWRGPEEMRAFYHALDVYVCASASEGTPNPCLEAAACGLPVVTTPVGNMPELIRHGHNGFFVERDAGDIARRLAELRDDAELRARMGEAARVQIEAWDWRKQAANYDALFHSVLPSRPPRSVALAHVGGGS